MTCAWSYNRFFPWLLCNRTDSHHTEAIPSLPLWWILLNLIVYSSTVCLILSHLLTVYCAFWVIYCLYSNPQSMRNKQNQLEHLVVERRCDLIGVMDTWRDDSLHLAIEQYNSLKKNRSHRNAEKMLKIPTSAQISKWVIIAIL